MRKMPCLFVRTFHGRNSFTMRNEVTPGCEWALAGEGIASRKRDGTACAVIAGILYKRYDAKRGKTPPVGAIPCDEPDPVTGHHPHWVRVGTEPDSKHHKETYDKLENALGEGTFELCGPKFSANPEGLAEHAFIKHGSEVLDTLTYPTTFEKLYEYLLTREIEGIVFAHPDGRMCKVRRGDYGLPWPLRKSE